MLEVPINDETKPILLEAMNSAMQKHESYIDGLSFSGIEEKDEAVYIFFTPIKTYETSDTIHEMVDSIARKLNLRVS